MIDMEEKNKRQVLAKAEEDNKKKRQKQEIEKKMEVEVEERRKEYIKIMEISYKVIVLEVEQVLDKGKRELEKVKTSPIV